MQLTGHAQTRMQQRGIPALLLQIIEECGIVSNAPGGAQEVFFGKKEAVELVGHLKRIIQAVDKTTGTAMLIKDSHIVTVYKKFKGNTFRRGGMNLCQ